MVSAEERADSEEWKSSNDDVGDDEKEARIDGYIIYSNRRYNI